MAQPLRPWRSRDGCSPLQGDDTDAAARDGDRTGVDETVCPEKHDMVAGVGVGNCACQASRSDRRPATLSDLQGSANARSAAVRDPADHASAVGRIAPGMAEEWARWDLSEAAGASDGRARPPRLSEMSRYGSASPAYVGKALLPRVFSQDPCAKSDRGNLSALCCDTCRGAGPPARPRRAGRLARSHNGAHCRGGGDPEAYPKPRGPSQLRCRIRGGRVCARPSS